MRESCCCEVDPREEKMEKMRIEREELIQRILRLETELSSTKKMLDAFVTVINMKWPNT